MAVTPFLNRNRLATDWSLATGIARPHLWPRGHLVSRNRGEDRVGGRSSCCRDCGCIAWSGSGRAPDRLDQGIGRSVVRAVRHRHEGDDQHRHAERDTCGRGRPHTVPRAAAIEDVPTKNSAAPTTARVTWKMKTQSMTHPRSWVGWLRRLILGAALPRPSDGEARCEGSR